MIINSLIRQGSKILKKQNIDSHQIDAELLLSKAIRKDRVFLLTNDEYKISQKETSDYLNFILRRVNRSYKKIFLLIEKIDRLSLEQKRQLTIPLIKELI